MQPLFRDGKEDAQNVQQFQETSIMAANTTTPGTRFVKNNFSYVIQHAEINFSNITRSHGSVRVL